MAPPSTVDFPASIMCYACVTVAWTRHKVMTRTSVTQNGLSVRSCVHKKVDLM